MVAPFPIADLTKDFQDVPNWEANKLDRTQSSRMGWSDVSLCLAGPAVQDLRTHFTQRWNFIYDEKYSKKASHYVRLPVTGSGAQQAPPQQRGFDGQEGAQERGFDADDNSGQSERGLFGRSTGGGGFRNKVFGQVSEGVHQAEQLYGHHGNTQSHQQYQSHADHGSQRGNAEVCILTANSHLTKDFAESLL